MISVVLVGIEKAGNVGAAARVMKNFGLKELFLVEPKCDHLSKEAVDRASHARDILKRARVVEFSYLEGFDYLVATTAKTGSDYNIPRIPLLPEEFSAKLKGMNAKAKIAILMGRESSGLLNKEIMRCDFTVTIPTSMDYQTMNVSHALAIILYEISKNSMAKGVKARFAPASAREKKVIFEKLEHILGKMRFPTEEKRETQRRLWKRLIGKSMLTKREAFALIGFLRRLE